MSVDVESLSIPDVKLIMPRRFADGRGFMSEVYNAQTLREAGIGMRFIQDNHSYSAPAFVLRGLHFQRPPAAQTKLVRVARGRIYDVAVDLRAGSPTYGKWVSAELSAENWQQILVPRGFAHGFLTLEPDTEVLYKVDAHYDPDRDSGLIWSDPDLGIDWPLSSEPELSDKDRNWPRFSGWESPFSDQSSS